MNGDDYRRLTKNYTFLKQELGQHELDAIYDKLVEKGIFQLEKKEEILAHNLFNSQKVDKFIAYLKGRGSKAYGQFRDALLSFSDERFEGIVVVLDNTELDTKRGTCNCSKDNEIICINLYKHVIVISYSYIHCIFDT